MRQKTQEIIKAALEELGFKVELKSIDAGIYFTTDVGNPDTSGKFWADLEMHTNSSDAYPSTWFERYRTDEIDQKSNGWSKSNAFRYSNPEFDTLHDQCRIELDEAKQVELFQKMMRMVTVDDVVEVPLVARKSVAAKGKKIQGYVGSAWASTPVYELKNWTLEGERSPTCRASGRRPAQQQWHPLGWAYTLDRSRRSRRPPSRVWRSGRPAKRAGVQAGCGCGGGWSAGDHPRLDLGAQPFEQFHRVLRAWQCRYLSRSRSAFARYVGVRQHFPHRPRSHPARPSALDTRATPSAAHRRASSGWSALIGTITIGKPSPNAPSTVLNPPCVITSAQRGRSRLCGM